jgi:hypothetical protein
MDNVQKVRHFYHSTVLPDILFDFEGLRQKVLREIGLGCVDWIRLAQDRDRWRAVVSAVMNLRVLAPRR